LYVCVCVYVCVVRTQQTTHGTRYLPAHCMQSLLPPRVTQHRQTLLPPHYTQSLNSTPTLAITTHHAYALFPDNLRPHLEPESMPFNAANSSSTCLFVGCCVGRSSVGCTHLDRNTLIDTHTHYSTHTHTHTHTHTTRHTHHSTHTHTGGANCFLGPGLGLDVLT
jgi:hypothetical protein